MSNEDIFLDDQTYFQKSFKIDQLIKMNNTSSIKQIARQFVSKQNNIKEIKDVVEHQLQNISEQIHPKYKQIFKQKLKNTHIRKTNCLNKQKQQFRKNNSSNRTTEADIEILDCLNQNQIIDHKSYWN